MVFVDLENWPEIIISKEAGWDAISKEALPLMNDIIEKFYPPGGTVIRAMAAKLLSGGIIKPHTDKHPSFHCGHRIHVPITANPRVRFMIDGQPYRFEVGEAYEINNQMKHSVMNKGAEDRITFIFDYVPKAEIEKLSAQSFNK
jgi:aspartyl/asparaginyl beta-hydroxylase (cupin superfamily)